MKHHRYDQEHPSKVAVMHCWRSIGPYIGTSSQSYPVSSLDTMSDWKLGDRIPARTLDRWQARPRIDRYPSSPQIALSFSQFVFTTRCICGDSRTQLVAATAAERARVVVGILRIEAGSSCRGCGSRLCLYRRFDPWRRRNLELIARAVTLRS